MRRIFITINMKRLLVYFAALMLFIIVLSATLIFFGKKVNATKRNRGKDIPTYSIRQGDISLNGSSNEHKVKVFITKENKIEEMQLEDYVRGVVASEMPATFEVEALKAQAVAARTYALAHIKAYGGTPCKDGNGADLCDTVHCQVYKSDEAALSSWSSKERETNWKKISEAVKDTSGEILTYEGDLVLEPYYFSTSSGITENGSEVFSSNAPYLRSVVSQGEEISPRYQQEFKFTYSKIASVINNEFPKTISSPQKLKSQMTIKSRNTESNSVKEVKIGSLTISGTQFRRLLGLNSSNFSFKFNSSEVIIICKGYGHGVGMSQWGANAMAKSGKSYKDILTHYYQGIKVEKMDK